VLALAASVVSDSASRRKDWTPAQRNEAAQEAGVLLGRLVKMQDQRGCWEEPTSPGGGGSSGGGGGGGATGLRYETITTSGGTSKMLEATAMAVLALLRATGEPAASGAWLSAARLGVECISRNAQFGGYGNTQANALSLEAIVELSQRLAQEIPDDAQLVVKASRGARELARRQLPVRGESATLDATFDGAELAAASSAGGPSTVRIEAELVLAPAQDGVRRQTKRFSVPFIADVSFLAAMPDSSANCSLVLATALDQARALEGDVVTLRVALSNVNKDKAVAMTVAKLGLPAGTEPRIDKLDELVKTKQLAYYETAPNLVVLYWYGLAAGSTRKVAVDLTAKIPGRFQAPASSAYVYYDAEERAWQPGVRLDIAADTARR
jgi:hypothetical protein